MKKAWHIFKEYYLLFVIVYLVLMTVIYFLEKRAEDLERFKFLMVFVAIFTLLLASIEHFKQVIYKPWKLNRILNRTPFLEFYNREFKRESNFLRGQINNYTIVLGVEWEFYQKGPEYYFQVLFNPFLNGRLLRQDECVKFNDELQINKKRFTLNSVVKDYGRRKLFLRTEYNDIINDINNAIDFLKVRKLEPINFHDWINYIPNVEKHAEKFIYE